jgi:hypothetical protein
MIHECLDLFGHQRPGTDVQSGGVGLELTSLGTSGKG